MSEDIPLTGEPLALDLVNTRPAGPEGRHDLLATPEQLSAWLALQTARLPGLVPDTDPTPDDLPPVHAVRRHTEETVRALMRGAAPPPCSLHALNGAQRTAPAVRALVWDGRELTFTRQRPGPLGVRLATLLAEAAVDLLTDPSVARVRECEAEDCVMLFLPAHPRRRWCSPSRCGNRARVARYYQRHKAPGNPRA
ncbi:CGNR zinc finger domain-containing protein [Nocardiopsis aegyptia]|uniref:Putative RNA-binding Zn ribbon-like protein n=1 Tax=Nocardiopsis aegyptia TaxID=220378 RepID=A0A7Z0EQY9_9ACTN|nr:ABATE domain-containing protein [Nocardiopsis aegyptia]NYJ35710.1 putative RNA-binding Zn ribbon-like protein [Nocardiopsis aegyptia]